MYVLNADLNTGQVTAGLQLLQLLPLFSLILCFPTAKFLFHFILLRSTNEPNAEFHQCLLPLGYHDLIFNFPACPFLASGAAAGHVEIHRHLPTGPKQKQAEHMTSCGRVSSQGHFSRTGNQLVTSLRPQLLGAGEPNERLLGRVNFLQTAVQVSLRMIWHQKS